MRDYPLPVSFWPIHNSNYRIEGDLCLNALSSAQATLHFLETSADAPRAAAANRCCEEPLGPATPCAKGGYVKSTID